MTGSTDTHLQPPEQARSRLASPISSEPLINALHRRLESALACLTALFIVYTTCLPTLTTVAVDAGTALVSKQDVIQNILLYVPFGFFAALALRRRRRDNSTNAGLVLFAAACLSAVAESLQLVLPGRVSSWVDLVCNIAGTACGVTAALFFRVGSGTSSNWEQSTARR